MENAQDSGKRNIIRGVAFVIIILLCFAVFFSLYSDLASTDRSELSKGWTVRYNGKEYRDVDLYRFRMPKTIRKGELVVLDNTIPLDIGVNKAMVFPTTLSTVTVYVNRRNAYMYNNDSERRVSTPGNGMNSVILSDNARGSECQVILKAGVDDAFRVLPIFYFVDAWNGSAMHINMYLGTCLVGFFETLFGVILLVISVALFFSHTDYVRVFATGLMSFTAGIWSLYDGNALELFSSDFTMNTQIGCLCLYFALIPFSLSVAVIRGRSRKKWKNISMIIGIIIPIAFFIVASLLDLSGKVYVSGTYNIFLVSAVISVAIIVLSTGDKGESRSKDVKILSAGIDMLFVGVVIDEIRYVLKYRIIVESRIMDKSIMPYVSLAFIIIVLYSYLVSMNDVYMEQANDSLLQMMAYTDALTGLSNRAYCRQSIEKLSKHPQSNYTIISLDVNGLKKINDSMGHAQGDQLIRDCAKILTEVFGEKGDVIRMGGDEFVVILYGRSHRRMTGDIRRMERLEKIVSEKRKYDIHISYGISSSAEESGIMPANVYKIADARMYEMKKRDKAVRMD